MVHMAKMAQTEAILAYISTEKKLNKNKKKTTRIDLKAAPYHN